MTKLKFILALEKRLSSLPQGDIEQHLTFYSEMIEDRVEDGLSEEEAVTQIGSVEEIAVQILAEYPANETKAVVEKQKRNLKKWELSLLILGSPLWISLLIAVLAVIFSVIVSAWSVVVSLWAVFVSMVVCGVALPIAAVYFICTGYVYSGLAVIGASLVCGGLGILFYYVCKWTTKGMALLTKVAAISLMKRFRRKEEV